MKKLLLTSATVFGIAGICMSANANIGANDSSASCDNSTIGASSGSTTLEAQWQANTITLKWYNDGEQFTPTNSSAAGECTYDQAMTLPSNTLSKEGYTFDGWTVKAAASNPFASLDMSLSPSGNGYSKNSSSRCDLIYTYGGQTKQNCSNSDYSDLEVGEWKVPFSYGLIKGTAVAAVAGGTTKYMPGTPDESASGNKYCWCKITEFNGVAFDGKWAFSYSGYGNSGCVATCASNFMTSRAFRMAMYDTAQYVNDCGVATDHDTCIKSVVSSYPYVYAYGANACSWTNSTCHNKYVTDCSEIQDAEICEASTETTSSWICVWDGESCYAYNDD